MPKQHNQEKMEIDRIAQLYTSVDLRFIVPTLAKLSANVVLGV
ncbi:hypothetical protein [Scytonema sp. NUACC26]